MSLFNKKQKQMSKYRTMNFIAPQDIETVHNTLKENINKEKSLEEILDQFFIMAKTPVTCNADLLFFDTDIENNDGVTEYILTLMRQIIIDEHYSVIELDIKYDIKDVPCIFKPINVCDLDVKKDFYDYIKETKQFKLLNDLKIKNIDLLFGKSN